MGIDPRFRYVAAAAMTAALGACSAGPTEPASAAASLDELSRQLSTQPVTTPGVVLPRDDFAPFFHS